jgi:hypothetical protein
MERFEPVEQRFRGEPRRVEEDALYGSFENVVALSSDVIGLTLGLIKWIGWFD